MSDESPDFRAHNSLTASRALLSAALGGLLCLGTACGSSKSSHPGPASTGGAGGASTGGSGGSATGGAGGSAGSATGGAGGGGGSATGGSGGSTTDGGPDGSSDAAPDSASDAASDASDAAALVYCSNAPDVGTVVSTQTVAMTEADFQTLCSAKGGTFEIMPHCGGFNSCMGISYDTGTQTLSDHTCRGLNTCAGYSCVICS